MISREDIQKLAGLARIKMLSEEEQNFAEKIDSILEYVGQIQKVRGRGDSFIATSHEINVMRDDNNPHESGIHTEAILNEAPKRDGQYIKVKKILGGGDNA
jgi:aspartyl-tRNA(Asn)/glutamyl-tRNA(Gln) amidotransferase subunit C